MGGVGGVRVGIIEEILSPIFSFVVVVRYAGIVVELIGIRIGIVPIVGLVIGGSVLPGGLAVCGVLGAIPRCCFVLLIVAVVACPAVAGLSVLGAAHGDRLHGHLLACTRIFITRSVTCVWGLILVLARVESASIIPVQVFAGV